MAGGSVGGLPGGFPVRPAEFPTLIPKDIDDIVIVIAEENEVFGIGKRSKKGNSIIPKEFVFLGKLPSFSIYPTIRNNFLSKIGEEIYIPHYFKEVYVINFKTLLTGYRLFQKDIRQFRRILATAKTEEEFCTLAGMD